MPNATIPMLSLSEASRRLPASGVYTAEIPVEDTTSILVPTLRLGFPAYAFFSAASARVAGEPPMMAAPDRWGALRVDSGQFALYARVEAVPLGGPALERIAVPPVAATVAEALAAQDRLMGLMDAAAEAFFVGDTPPSGLAAAFAAAVPEVLRPAYRALAPDFMDFMGLP